MITCLNILESFIVNSQGVMNKDVLDRIADALERIAYVLESNMCNTTKILDEGSKNETEVGSCCEADEDEEFSIIEQDCSVIIDFLKTKLIEVKCLPEREEVNDSLTLIAFFMGSRYSYIQKVYDKIKTSLNQGKGFKLDMKNFTQLEISNSCQLCTHLSNIAFLSDYKYYKSPKYIMTATANRIPLVINFLTGHWLELYVKKVVLDALYSMNKRVEYSCIINPQIILPNGNDFEFDVMYLIEGYLYWIEAKTGNYQNYVEKYSKIATLFGENEVRPYMVLTDILGDKSIQTLSKLFNMKVCYVEDFSNVIKEDLTKDLVD